KDKSVNKGNNVNIDYQTKPKSLVISGFGGYKLEKIKIDNDEIPLIKIPLVTWGGYAALFAANNGIKPNKESSFYKNGKFVVELVREEDSNTQLQNFASGNYPIIWSTMDMLPLIYDTLKTDKRVIPQVFGLFDWSFGGDGIIVRQNIRTPKDLKGKRVVTSGNTPSNFFLLWLIAQSGLNPSDVIIQYVDDAIAAKDAFIKDNKIDACVTWSPFLYEITDPSSKSYVDGTRLLITSKDANQLIADCYLTRLDFLKDHPDIIQNFSKSMMEGFDLFKANPQKVYNEIASLFKLTGGANEASLMLQDVHIANFPENQMFFNIENSISAYKIFLLSMEYYKNVGSLSIDASYEPEIVINTSTLEKIAKTNQFATQQNTIKNSFNQQGSFNIADLESKNVVLTENLQIYFDPQRVDFDFDGNSEEIKKNKQYLKKISEQMNVLGTTVLKLVGHIDTTKVSEFKSQGQQVYIEASAQAKLISKKRAEYIKKILVEKYACDKERIFTEGKGWDMPVDSNDQSLNRRVEVKFFSFE
ncbi:MAG TPA: phosphate ABC transporter substrate-binding/OmpA family protein, partial [Spirochaetota bacterium]|nr:phosphate ABC transporter substrate-binding/OmpA family protein [Spirochaetota bacterium]